VEIDGLALEFRGDAGRERMAEVNGIDHVERLLVIHDCRIDFRVMSSAGTAGDGLNAAAFTPRRRNSASSAAVTCVLPTAVSVPVMKRF